MQYIQSCEPIKVHGLVVASTGCEHTRCAMCCVLCADLGLSGGHSCGSRRAQCLYCSMLCALPLTAARLPLALFLRCAADDDPSLGCPVEYINLRVRGVAAAAAAARSPAMCSTACLLHPSTNIPTHLGFHCSTHIIHPAFSAPTSPSHPLPRRAPPVRTPRSASTLATSTTATTGWAAAALTDGCMIRLAARAWRLGAAPTRDLKVAARDPCLTLPAHLFLPLCIEYCL